MHIGGIGSWRRQRENGQLVIYRDADRRRMGLCDWLPSDGDVCLVTNWGGDCFDDYTALRKREDGCYEKVGTFGAYTFGEVVGRLDGRDFFFAQAGEPVRLSIATNPTPAKE